MIAVHSAGPSPRKADRKARESAPVKRRPLKILAVVDGSERAGRVVEYLVNLAARDKAIKAVVLNVQPSPEDWRLRGYGSFKRGEIVDRLVGDLGKPIVASVGRALDRAGIGYKVRVEIGDPAETVLRCAREENADLVLTAERRAGPFLRWLGRATGISFGSVSAQLVEFADIPVVVVK
jgi:nucleotide-binding universal stress UspA family protein